jgi:Uma2 family endonuclease
MISQLTSPYKDKLIYPDSDGQPMADNTLQFAWIVTIKENLECLFASREDVFVAGDLLWYPVEGQPKICQAPDTMVVFGRPKGYRGSYKQWEEDDLAPQVVFEILSPGNRFTKMLDKFRFYERYGVNEYYLYDPEKNQLQGWTRQNDELIEITEMNNWISPCLEIRFQISEDELILYYPDGQRFLTFVELRQELQQEKSRAEKLAQLLREQGIDPDQI